MILARVDEITWINIKMIIVRKIYVFIKTTQKIGVHVANRKLRLKQDMANTSPTRLYYYIRDTFLVIDVIWEATRCIRLGVRPDRKMKSIKKFLFG